MNESLTWGCHTEAYDTHPMSLLWYGFGALSLAYGLYMILWATGEELQEALSK